MLICQVAVLSHQFREDRERSKAFAMCGIIFGIGLGFGPIIGGMTVALASWQWVFLIHVLLAVRTLVLIVRGVQESRDPQAKKLDGAGIVTLTVAVFCLAYFIMQGPNLGFGSRAALGIIAVAGAVSSRSSLWKYSVRARCSISPCSRYAVFPGRSLAPWG